MDYKGWVLSIYDEYKDRSDKNKNKNITSKSKIDNLKESFKFLIKKGNRLKGITILVSMLLTIIIYCLYIIRKDDILLSYLFIPWIMLFIIVLPEWYKYETKLEVYEREVEILREVLKERKLYSGHIIQELYTATRGVFFKVKIFLAYLIGIVVSSGLIRDITSMNKQTIKYMVFILLILIIFLIPILYFVWMIMISIPNNRIERSKNFHKLLKILILYDKDSLGISDERLIKLKKH